ncbi:hypothetical protein MKW94_025384 [Papaver nudicaule]|uniref:Prolamin-like domain-containing protein n=1 Tax=Papaver nudicaule TaxID=74823 RepID=A0AA41VXB1_PAPNU|nr:hypothetical protein [Papaver nudicaule]
MNGGKTSPQPAPVASAVTMGTAESQAIAPTQQHSIQIPGLIPPLLPLNPDIEKCWSTLVDIEGCKAEILNFLVTFELQLGPACCKAIIGLSETCLPAVFSSSWGWGRGIPFNPRYPNIVNGYCASITKGTTSPTVEPPTTSVASAVTMGTGESQDLAPTQLDTMQISGLFPPLLPYNPVIRKCWSTLVEIEGCKAEILNFLFTFQLQLGPACCKAITSLDETCLPVIFSSGWGRGGVPFFLQSPKIIKGYCASITGGKKSPPAPSAAHMSPPSPSAPQVQQGAPKPAPIEPPATSIPAISSPPPPFI